MTQARALGEIRRFLSTKDPEVLSISGRWGVGKTYAWDETLKAMRAATPLRRYAYVSAFGLRSLEALKTAIVQSTVSLEGKDLEPSVESFVEHVASFGGLKKLGEEASRKGLSLFIKGAAAVPYVGKMADLLAPGAALLIRNEIICIDDIERAGQGLDVGDILGLVSSLRERRGCKVVLLLNEDGLGAQAEVFRTYLEKVVDQAVKFEPTPAEAAAAALDAGDPLTASLSARTVSLGITNIRVIRRIRRFLGYLEPSLAGLHQGVTAQVVQSIALLGWCVFEPLLAPPVERVQAYSRYAGMFSDKPKPAEEAEVSRVLSAYGFGSFDDLDQIVLDGVQRGAFDLVAFGEAARSLDAEMAEGEARAAIGKGWSIFQNSLGDDAAEFTAALIEAVEQYSKEMTPGEASEIFGVLSELDRAEEVERLLPIYLAAQDGKPRAFFERTHAGRRDIDARLESAFTERLAAMPLVRDPGEVLLRIASNRSWGPSDIAFLASVPVEGYRQMLHRWKDGEQHTAIPMALDFGRMADGDPNYRIIGERMRDALRLVGAESPLNRLRTRPYLDGDEGRPVASDDGGSPTAA